MADYEQGLEGLNALIEWVALNPDPLRNEAQTRFDLIDRVLLEALGWTREQIRVEESQGGTFTDYELGVPARLAVVEAKREGTSFDLPAGFDRSTISLDALRKMDPRVAAAIDQAALYAQTRGIQVAAVTNGAQLVVFVGARTDGVAPREGRALVYPSLISMRDRFKELWNVLSPPGLAARGLLRLLQVEGDRRPPRKLSTIIPDYPGYKNRNPVAAELQILGGLFFEDIIKQPESETEFLRECYTPSGSLSQYALVSREILAARYSVYEAEAEATLEPVRTRAGVSDHLLTDVFAASLSQRPIILLGDVGVGKTIFTRHFIKVEAVDILDRSFVLYLDFGSKPALATDLGAYVRSEFKRQLLEEYGQDIDESGFVRSVYRPELQRFESGIFGSLKDSDPVEFNRRSLEYLASLVSDEQMHLKRSLEHFTKAQKRQAVVFLDNVDQRPFAFQEEVFLIAQALAADWPVTSFIAMRPETFYRSKREGALTGYQPRVFTIEPPRVDRVLHKRLAFTRLELERSGSLSTFPKNVTVGSERLSQYLDLLIDAFHDNEDLVRFVDNMSGGNVRRALSFIVSFVGSGHVDTTKIFDALDRSGYTLPLHEFARAVIYGEHEHFDPLDSPIANVLDLVLPDGREHFLQSIIIRLVESSGRGTTGQGFVPTADVYAYCQDLGFTPSQVGAALDRCAEKLLLETLPRYIHEEVKGSEAERCRVTSIGLYTVDMLLPQFLYLDAVAVDTPIVDGAYRDRIGMARTIEERLQRVEILREYLDEMWKPLESLALPFDWPSASKVAVESMFDVKKGLERAARRRAKRH